MRLTFDELLDELEEHLKTDMNDLTLDSLKRLNSTLCDATCEAKVPEGDDYRDTKLHDVLDRTWSVVVDEIIDREMEAEWK